MNTSKICQRCGKEFTDRKHPNRKYCSLQCSTLQKTKREQRTCPGCGTVFYQHNTLQKYCTPECGFKHRPRPNVKAKKRCECEWCKKEFETWNSRPGRFCCEQCRSEFAARQPKGKRGKRVILYCEICSREYVIYESYYKLRGSRFCSLECKQRGNSIDKMGTGNPNYIGGTRYPDRGRNWWSQRRAALKRDNATCQLCGRKAKKHERRIVEVHHIRPYKDFEGNYLAANELSNLITLCRKCHTQVENHELPCPKRLF